VRTLILLAAGTCALGAPSAAVRVTWTDTAALHPRLEAAGITAGTFASYAERAHQANERRVRDGDLDHLIFYALQSTRFTTLAPIEPALSASALVGALDDREREAFLQTSRAEPGRVPSSARSRLAALLRVLEAPGGDPRLRYFREVVDAAFPVHRERDAVLAREYLRVMRFVYEKEFVAPRSPRGADAVAALYRTRGLSTDTAVESGYLVSLGLGVIKALEPDRRIRRVLIVGPGLDLAPRTAMLEDGPPESYQPWAVIDGLLAAGLTRLDDLTVVAADINPRVVAHLRRARIEPPALTLVSELRDSGSAGVSAEFRDYFVRLGRAVGEVKDSETPPRAGASFVDGRLRKVVRINPAAARVLRAETLDVVTERLDEAPFDLAIATNVLPYFDDVALMLAMSNVAAMLAPGGIFLHNEARPSMGDVTAALGLPLEQSRRAILASPRGAVGLDGAVPPPLVDGVWLHRKSQSR